MTPRDSDLARRELAVNQAMLALGNELFEAEGARFVRNREVPADQDGNHVTHVTAATPDEIDRLLARVEREYSGIPHRRFDLDPFTPPAFEARIAHGGCRAADMLVMVLEGEVRGEARPHDVRLVDGDERWRDYEALNRLDWQAYVELGSPGGAWNAAEMFRARRRKSPPGRYWLAYVEGQPVSYLASWEGREGVGIVDDLFTHPDFRRRGLASALIHRCVADCRRRGAGPIVIVASPTDTPRQMYAALGFRPLAIKRNWVRDANPSAPANVLAQPT